MRGSLGTALGVAFLALSTVYGQQAPSVYTAEIDGIIHPVAAKYVREVIAKADAAGAALVVLTLRTPGGLVDSTRDINNAIIHAKTPVAVFVGPSGNRAASAGFLITMARPRHPLPPLRRRHPVGGNCEKSTTRGEENGSYVAAYARTLRPSGSATSRSSTCRGESRSFTIRGDVSNPPLIDLVVTSP